MKTLLKVGIRKANHTIKPNCTGKDFCRWYKNLTVIEKSRFRKILCPYDGFVLRMEDEKYIEYLKNEPQFKRFKMKKHSIEGYTFWKGKFANLKIKVHYVYPGIWVADISGSVHKFFNKGKHNHNDFSYLNFLKVICTLFRVLNVNPYKANVVGLEVGANLNTSSLNLFIEEIFERILFMLNKCKLKLRDQNKRRDSLKIIVN